MNDQTSSREVSRAKISPMPESEKEPTEPATSGLKCLQSFPLSNPDSFSLKMCEALLHGTEAWHSKRCALTWKRLDTPFKRSLFQLAPSTPRTVATGYGLRLTLPTPQASDFVEGARTAPESNQACIQREFNRMLPTPRSADGDKGVRTDEGYAKEKARWGNRNGEDLPTVIAHRGMLPTPATRDYKGASQKNPRDTVDSLVETGATKGEHGTKTGLRLQPDFAGWMLGYPMGYLNLADGEMPRSRRTGTQSSRK